MPVLYGLTAEFDCFEVEFAMWWLIDSSRSKPAAGWDRPYSREFGAFLLTILRQMKYWPPVGQVDNVYGDRNLVCSCVPVSDFA